MKPALGTFVEIGVFEPDVQVGRALAAAFAQIAAIENLMSFQDPSSELSRLNGAQGAPVVLSRLTRQALRLACALDVASGGLFNCTVGGTLVSAGRLPRHGSQPYLDVGKASDIEFLPGGARLRRPVLVTLDGIAKGLAVDRALAELRRRGTRDAWINAGGDVRVIGRHSLPVHVRGSTVAVALSNGAIATSASGAEPDPTLPGSIVGASGIAAGRWSVLAAKAWRADALTKVAAVAPAEHRAVLLDRLGGRLIDCETTASSRAA